MPKLKNFGKGIRNLFKTGTGSETKTMTWTQYFWYKKFTFLFYFLLVGGIIGGILAYFFISKSQNKDQDISQVTPVTPIVPPTNNTFVDPDICKNTETSRVILYNAMDAPDKYPINHAINNNNEDIKSPVKVEELSIPSNEAAYRNIKTIYIGSFKIRNCKIVLSTINKFTEDSANKEYVHNTSDTKACLEIDLKKEHPTLIFQSAYIEPNREVIIYVKDVKDPIILKHDDIKGVVTRRNISVSSIKIRNCTVTLKNSCEPQIKYIEPDVLKHNSRVDNSFYKEKTGITDVNCLIIQP